MMCSLPKGLQRKVWTFATQCTVAGSKNVCSAFLREAKCVVDHESSEVAFASWESDYSSSRSRGSEFHSCLLLCW